MIRPLGWENCWFIDVRRRGGRNPADRTKIDRTPKEHPKISVLEYDALNGWKSKLVYARTYIARLFWDYEFEPNFKASHERHMPDGTVKVIHTDQWISSYKVGTTCLDKRCVNPSHFVFHLDRSQKLGGDGKVVRPNAGKPPSGKKRMSEFRKRGYFGPV